jgi:hypothetical protein
VYLSGSPALRPCPRCECALHKCNCFPCWICDRVSLALKTYEENSARAKEQVIAELTSELAEYNQPPLSEEELTAIRKYPTLAAWEAFAYPGILGPEPEEPGWNPAHLAKFPLEEVL